MSESALVNALVYYLHAAGLPDPVREYRFCPTRKWRADLAYPDARLLIECDGGTWSGGRHVSGSGFEGDCEKTNEAQLLGYRILRFTGGMINGGMALDTIERALGRG